jgi:hypothetical protein
MRKVLFAVVVLSLILGAMPLYAATVVGYSNWFSIDNTLGAPPPVDSKTQSPYTVPGDYLLRGQFHAHAICDRWPNYHPQRGQPIGNDLTYWELCDRYKTQGMDFLGITDHCKISPSTNPYGSDILWIPRATEITEDGGHIIALDVSTSKYDDLTKDSFTGDPVTDVSQQIKNVKNTYGGMAFIAHPDGGVFGLISGVVGLDNSISFKNLNAIFQIAKPDGIAMYSLNKNMVNRWQNLIDIGWQIWGFAEDDYHDQRIYTTSCRVIGRTWVGVPQSSSSVTWSDVRSILEKGEYYIYWVEGGLWPNGKIPPQMSVSVTYPQPNRPKISVTLSGIEAPPSGRTKWLRFIGRHHWDSVIRTRSYATYIPHDSTYHYHCNGTEGFVRVEASLPYEFGTLKISSQPIMVHRTGNPYEGLAAATEYGVLSTSPELQLQYLEPEEKPLPPPGGYLSDVYEVTTDNGLLPPNAVLELSYAQSDLSARGGTSYLGLYWYDPSLEEWINCGGSVNLDNSTVIAEISDLGIYAISVDLPEDTTAPDVFIDNPPTGGVVAADTAVMVTVNDDLGAYQVSFYMNDYPLDIDDTGLDGWSVDLPIENYCTGDWMLKAVAVDLAGNTGEVEIPIYVVSETPRPTVSITSPGDGAELSGTFTITGECWDDVLVEAVRLYIDGRYVDDGMLDGAGGWTAAIDLSEIAGGVRTLTAVVNDYPGNESSASISVIIDNPGFRSAKRNSLRTAKLP